MRVADRCVSVGCRLATQSREDEEKLRRLIDGCRACWATIARLAPNAAFHPDPSRPFSPSAPISHFSPFAVPAEIRCERGQARARNQAQNLTPGPGRQFCLTSVLYSRIEGNLSQASDGQPQKEQAAE